MRYCADWAGSRFSPPALVRAPRAVYGAYLRGSPVDALPVAAVPARQAVVPVAASMEESGEEVPVVKEPAFLLQEPMVAEARRRALCEALKDAHRLEAPFLLPVAD